MPAMLRNLLSVVILSICLATSAQAVSLNAVKKFYQSLHKVLKSKQVQNKAGHTDLTPLHEFLQGKPLDKDMRDELAMFSDEYGDILKAKFRTKSKTEEVAISIADLLKYSKLQETRAYDELFNIAIKSLPSENKLYLFNIKMTLADDTVVTLIKPGMSNANRVSERVRGQMHLLEGIADNLDDVTFTLPRKGELKVKAMHIEQENLAGRKKYLDLNFGVIDGDVHRHLQELDYQLVHGIPNRSGGERKEVFIKIADGKYEDSNHVQDVADMLEYANHTTHRERRNASATKKDSGISLNLGEYKTKLIFAQMQGRASEFKDKKSELASILADIKCYEHETGNGNGLRTLYDEFAKQFSDANLERVERLSEEVYLTRRMIAVERRDGEQVQDVARRLGFGVGRDYTSKKHLKDGLDSRALVNTDLILANDYADNTELHKLFSELISLRDDAEQITKAKDLLHKSIDKAGGWDALQKAMQTSDKSAASDFRSKLADAALKGKDEDQITEAITFYRIISVARRDGETPERVARRLGFGVGKHYSSKTHLEDGWEFDLKTLEEKLAELEGDLGKDDIKTLDDCIDILRELDKTKDSYLSRQLEDLISKKAKGVYDADQITKANNLLQKSIDKAGGWQALEEAMQTSGENSVSKFRNNLADAVLKGRDENQIAEAIAFYRIISVARRDGETAERVARRIGFGIGKKAYSSKMHLEDGLLDIEALVSMDLTLANDYADRKDLRELFAELTSLRDDAEQITKASNLLQKSIDKTGGWQALKEASSKRLAVKFRNNLADAALRGKDEKQIAEAITFYRIIAVARMDGENLRLVFRRLGVGEQYSSKTHLEEGWEFQLDELEDAVAKLKGESGNKYDFDTIDDCMDILRELREPEQLNLPLAV